jgi:hypothetical protein
MTAQSGGIMAMAAEMNFDQVPLAIIQERIAKGEITEIPDNGECDSDSGFNMQSLFMENLPYPDWQAPLQAALLELNEEKLRQHVAATKMAIAERLMSLASETNCRDEQQALADAMSTLRVLMREDV